MNNEYSAQISPYGYIGEVPALGSQEMTMLARSFDEVAVTDLSDLFPYTEIEERTIVVEQVIDGLGIMPIVAFGRQSGGNVEPSRVRSFSFSPVVVRENDFIEQHLINQIRKVGTMNDRWNPADVVAERIRQLVARHTRVVTKIQCDMLTGGSDYIDPRTNQAINASSNIPLHNFFSYKGWNAVAAAGSLIPLGGYAFSTNSAFVNNKGRTEATHFTSTDGRIGVPFTDPRADIFRCINLMKAFFLKANKNKATDLIIGTSLLTVIVAVNELLRTYQGDAGVLVLNQPSATVAGNSSIAPGSQTSNPLKITYTGDGQIATLCGLRVREMVGQYRNPVTNTIENYWPNNKIVILAAKAANGPETLGMTWHPTGESEDGAPGLYMRNSGPSRAPEAPGQVIQMGDAFLPVPIYPHWILVAEVCEENEVDDNFLLDSQLGFGTF